MTLNDMWTMQIDKTTKTYLKWIRLNTFSNIVFESAGLSTLHKVTFIFLYQAM